MVDPSLFKMFDFKLLQGRLKIRFLTIIQLSLQLQLQKNILEIQTQRGKRFEMQLGDERSCLQLPDCSTCTGRIKH
jgi:hypothetical protein